MSCLRRGAVVGVGSVLLAGVVAPEGAAAAPGSANQTGTGAGGEVVELLDVYGDPLTAGWQINNLGQVLASYDHVWDARTGTALRLESGATRTPISVDISDTGEVVGNQFGQPFTPFPPFTWFEGELTELSEDPDFVGAVNDEGQVLGVLNELRVPVVWDGDEIIEAPIEVGADEFPLPADINNRGLAVWTSADLQDVQNPETTAFVWKVGGGVTELGTLGGDFSEALAVNKRGHVVGTSETASGEEHAFLWRRGEMVDLGTLGGAHSMLGEGTGWEATVPIFGPAHLRDRSAINDRGEVVGTSETASGEEHAFLWRRGEMVDLGTLGGATSRATAVNEHGQVVGVSETVSGEEQAFVWQHGEMTQLDPLGEQASFALDINDWGQIVGAVGGDLYGNEPADYRAVMWTVEP